MITPTGQVTEYVVPTIDAQPNGIALGPDANLWFTEVGGNKIAVVEDAKVPAVVVSPDSGPPSTTVNMSGSGFGALERVSVSYVDSVHGSTKLGTVTTDALGRFSLTAAIPAIATTGIQQITAHGSSSHLLVQSPFTVT